MNTTVKRFTKNVGGRDFAIGDIHGHFSLLATALAAIGFNESTDRLFSVGDLVDRGPESHLALEWLAKPWFHAVQGNHEDMAIRWPNGFMDAGNYTSNGGGWNVANTPDVRRQFSDAFNMLPVAMQVDTDGGPVGIVHADCPFASWSDLLFALTDPAMTRSGRKAAIDAALAALCCDRLGVRGCHALLDQGGKLPKLERRAFEIEMVAKTYIALVERGLLEVVK